MPIQPVVTRDYWLESIDRNVTRLRDVLPSSSVRQTGLARSQSGDPQSISFDDARSLVQKAETALDTVRRGLEGIRANVESASNNALLSAVGEQSRLTLQTDIRNLIETMDDAVTAATVGNANLVSSQYNSVRLPTTGLGGAIVAAVQALDSGALGLDKIDVTTDEGVANALSAVSSAVYSVSAKAEQIGALGASYRGLGEVTQGFQSAFENAVTAFASIGAGTNTYGTDGRQNSLRKIGSLIDMLA